MDKKNQDYQEDIMDKKDMEAQMDIIIFYNNKKCLKKN